MADPFIRTERVLVLAERSDIVVPTSREALVVPYDATTDPERYRWIHGTSLVGKKRETNEDDYRSIIVYGTQEDSGIYTYQTRDADGDPWVDQYRWDVQVGGGTLFIMDADTLSVDPRLALTYHPVTTSPDVRSEPVVYLRDESGRTTLPTGIYTDLDTFRVDETGTPLSAVISQLLVVNATDVPVVSRTVGDPFDPVTLSAVHAPTTLYLWYRGRHPLRSMFVASVTPETYDSAFPTRIRHSGLYSLWIMQVFGPSPTDVPGTNYTIETDNDGSPLVRWALSQLMEVDGRPLDRNGVDQQGRVHIKERMTLRKGRTFALPDNRFTGKPMAQWSHRALNVDYSVPVPQDRERVTLTDARDEYALQGVYRAEAPLIDEPLLSAALATVPVISFGNSVPPSINTITDSLSAIMAASAFDDAWRGLTAIEDVFDPTASALLVKLDTHTQLQWLAKYYHIVLTQYGDQLLNTNNARAVGQLVYLLGVALQASNATTLEEREFLQLPVVDAAVELEAVKKSVGLASRYAPDYVPFLLSSFDGPSSLVSIEERTIIDEFYDALASQMPRLEEGIHTVGRAQQILNTVVQVQSAPVGQGSPNILPINTNPLLGGTTVTQQQQILNSIRAQQDTARNANATIRRMPDLANLPRSSGNLIVSQSSIGEAIPSHMGGTVVVATTRAPTPTLDARDAMLAVLRLTPGRVEHPAIGMQSYVHEVVATVEGVDRNTGKPYDVTNPEWGSSQWLATPPVSKHATWFQARMRDTGRSSPPALYKVLWEGEQRFAGDASAQFAIARHQLHIFARQLQQLERVVLPISRRTLAISLIQLYPPVRLDDMTPEQIGSDPYLVLRKIVSDTGSMLTPFTTHHQNMAFHVLPGEDITTGDLAELLAEQLAYYGNQIDVVVQPQRGHILVTGLVAMRLLHPAIVDGGMTNSTQYGSTDRADDTSDMLLDYVRILPLNRLQSLRATYTLSADSLPSLAFVDVEGVRSVVPEGVWIGTPSSWTTGQVRVSVLDQVLQDIERVRLLREDTTLDAETRDQLIKAVHEKPLHWSSFYVDLRGVQLVARQHLNLVSY